MTTDVWSTPGVSDPGFLLFPPEGSRQQLIPRTTDAEIQPVGGFQTVSLEQRQASERNTIVPDDTGEVYGSPIGNLLRNLYNVFADDPALVGEKGEPVTLQGAGERLTQQEPRPTVPQEAVPWGSYLAIGVGSLVLFSFVLGAKT